MHSFFFLFLVTAVSLFSFSSAKDQTVKVFGKLFCNNNNLPNYEILLMEHDTLDPDDQLNSTRSDQFGNFKVSGHDDEFTAIKPYLRVNHTCGVNADRCYRISDYIIPPQAIDTPDYYAMGKVSLNVKGDQGDKKVCK